MDNQPIDKQDEKPMDKTFQKSKIGLPIVALSLDLLPILLAFIISLTSRFSSSIILLFMVLSPLAGLVTGIVSLSRGKDSIGIAGKVIAIIAVVLPLSFVAFIIAFFVGVTTGLISLM